MQVLKKNSYLHMNIIDTVIIKKLSIMHLNLSRV